MNEEENDDLHMDYFTHKPKKSELEASKPTGFVVGRNAKQAPDGNLTLKYVHGFNCQNSKMMARYGNPGNIVFCAAAVGVKMNVERRT